ncbi:flagellar basal body L-ring protein FlgH [Lacibacterium aquatile]|uniref:Flagellar L-ring protein n=1 Tax=Lacibacterium aquatile TaxID=1168082 RepID=A0ABW5DMT3_9PROT
MVRVRKSLALLLTGATLAGCNAVDRIQNIGATPQMSPIENPTTQPGYRSISLPMPPAPIGDRQANSLWRPGSRAFFKDLRANRVGDIVTVVVSLNERAQLQNATTRTRTNSEGNTLTSLFGLQNGIEQMLPGDNSLPNMVDLESDVSNRGTGQINRSEQVNMRLAAIITQVLPNGNMVLHGRQEVRINYEIRELQLAGIIRPEDISPQNTIDYDKIAEARVSYGGRGQIMDVQQPRYGSQFLDIILPF